MELIETIEVGAGGAASIEFTSIPQDGVDLLLVCSVRSTEVKTRDAFGFQFNNDTATNYARIYLAGINGSVSTNSNTDDEIYSAIPGGSFTADTFSNTAYLISNYTSTATKSVSGEVTIENNGTDNGLFLIAASYSGSSAITSIKSKGGPIAEFSSFSLYIIS